MLSLSLIGLFELIVIGLSKEEFGKFMKRVPTHLKEKFNKIVEEFNHFDKNADGVIDSDEFGSMLDKVMKET